MADQSLAKQFGKNVAHSRNRESGELGKLGFTELFLPPEVGEKNRFVGLPDPGVIQTGALHTLNSLNYIA